MLSIQNPQNNGKTNATPVRNNFAKEQSAPFDIEMGRMTSGDTLQSAAVAPAGARLPSIAQVMKPAKNAVAAAIAKYHSIRGNAPAPVDVEAVGSDGSENKLAYTGGVIGAMAGCALPVAFGITHHIPALIVVGAVPVIGPLVGAFVGISIFGSVGICLCGD
jgi:hypothetical protein